jgi:hypothetical protein
MKTEIVDKVIKGRVEPHIYAFITDTIPSYTKIGDTYRSVNVRIDEWRAKYENIIKLCQESALVNEETYFRDHAVHDYLKNKGYNQLKPDQVPPGIYYSSEFYEGVEKGDVTDAITEIKSKFGDPCSPYTYYNVEDRLPQAEQDYKRTEPWKPRGNQVPVIDNFVAAWKAGRTNLLMYAVMRFGKTFTALCCAKAMDAKLVVVVSGKTSVRQEWKENVQRPLIFEGYRFVDVKKLKEEKPSFISDTLRQVSGGNKVVVFLTLQDLLGEKIKGLHQDLFDLNSQGKIDLLIIDETHFAARSSKTGAVLLKEAVAKKEEEGDDESMEKLNAAIKVFKPRVRLHLSGTPYRIMLNGEFKKEDIIATVQYRDIYQAKQDWYSDEKNLERNEWENPYYGFPQMVRFAFHPNESAKAKLEQMSKDGREYHLNELFSPISMSKNNPHHRKFKHEKEVIDMLQAIDGKKEDKNIFSFLNYDKITESAKMCRHIVMVLPWRASCDAMEALLKQDTLFNKFKQYTVLNISGFGCPQEFSNSDYSKNIKAFIDKCESENKRTITLTVGKMLTGSTVKEWDTMIFLKDTSSPQEYDQAIYRLQSQYVKKIKWDTNSKKPDGEEEYLRRDMKPQTLLVDFDPSRMFRLQYSSAVIANAAVEGKKGNDAIKETLKRDVAISPIIYVNMGKIEQVTENDIVNEIRKYNNNKSVLEEAHDVFVDEGLLAFNELKDIISKQAEITDLQNIFKHDPYSGEGTGIDCDSDGGSDTHHKENKDGKKPVSEADDQKALGRKLQTYYFKILLFAYLSDYKEKSLADVVNNIERYEDCQRIAQHLMLDLHTLKLIQKHINYICLSNLDNKINNIDDLSNDATADVETALRKFSRLSKNIIITPIDKAQKMVDNLPADLSANSRFLNIAGKTGEFEYALINRYKDAVKKNIYTLPLNGVTYECTLKMFKLLGIPTENIITEFYSYDLIDKNKKEEYIKRLKEMKFDAIIGNPPYNSDIVGDGNGSDPLYHLFVDLGMSLTSEGMLIHPARFLFNAGKTPKDWNQKMLNDPHFKVADYWVKSSDVFPDVEINGGIVISLWNKHENYGKIGFFSPYKELHSIYEKVKSKDESPFSSIVGPRELYGLTDVLYKEHPELEGRQSKGHKYSLGANIFSIFPELFYDSKPDDGNDYVLIYGRKNNQRCSMWFKKAYITTADNLSKYKVIISKADGAAGKIGNPIPARVLGRVEIGQPDLAYTDTFIGIGSFDTLAEAEACQKYVMSRFARTMLCTIKVTQDNSKELWANVPLQDFTASSDVDWSCSIADIDHQLFAKYDLKGDEIQFIESMIKPMDFHE